MVTCKYAKLLLLTIFSMGLLSGLLLLPDPIKADGPIAIDPNLAWSADNLEDSYDLAWGDLEGDGDLDLAVARYGQNAIFFNIDGELAISAGWFSADSGNTTSLAWGDLEGDGDLDLAAGNQDGSAVVYLNNGGSLQQNPIWTATMSVIETRAVAWGDMNGDGFLDLAVGSATVPNQVYLNQNGVLETTPAWNSAVTRITENLAWGDVDNDGDLDLAVTAQEGNQLYRNNGGLLETTPVWTTTVDRTYSLAWGDINNDSRLDLVTGGISNTYIYLNTGSTLSSTPVWTSTEDYGDESTHAEIALGDLDNDGDLDLAEKLDDDTPLRIYQNIDGVLNTSAGWTGNDPDFARSIAIANIDGDRDLDLIVGSFDQDKVYLNKTVPLQIERTTIATDAQSIYSLALADVDGDGDLDLAAGDNEEADKLYLNLNGRLNINPAWTSDETLSTTSVAWGDVDGDGDLDLATGNGDSENFIGEANNLYLNTGQMLETTASWTSDESDITESVAWGDVDNDGDLDLAVGNYGQANQLYLNQNGLLETSATWLSEETDKTYALAWGDVDNDGDLDLAVGNGELDEPDEFNINRLYLNQGGQLEAEASWSSADRDVTTSLAWGDVDGDGDLDLAVGNLFSPNRIHLNIDGVLEKTALWSSRDADETRAIAWGDVDGDGDLDLIAGNKNSPEKIYLNDLGFLEQIATWQADPKTNAEAIALGDLNNDGGLDMVAAGEFTTTLYLNRRPAALLYPGQSSAVRLALESDPVQTFNQATDTLAPASFGYAVPGIRSGTIPFTYTLFAPNGASIGAVAGYYSLTGGDSWLPAGPTSDTPIFNLETSPYPTPTLASTHVYTWDVFNSGFFGQSDNVVFRLQAFPIAPSHKGVVTGTYRYTNTAPGNYQNGYYSAQTYPFRVRGNQIRVVDNTTPISNALVYRLPAGQTSQAETYTRNDGQAFRTDAQGYLQGQGKIAINDQLFALSPATGEVNTQVSSKTYFSSDLPKVIAETGEPTIRSELTIPTQGTILDLDVVNLSGTHTYIGDLNFILESPLGAQVEILYPYLYCGDEEDFNLTLDDEAENNWYCEAPAQTHQQSYQPDNALSLFDGEESNGIWTLIIHDNSNFDGGQLDTWGLRIQTQSEAKNILYYTNAQPVESGLTGHQVTQTGVQTLTISTDNPLYLFNLDISLEWDARNNIEFLEQLKFDLRRASELLFDATNGQAALGQVNLYHDKQHWSGADIRLSASNALIPNADVGGNVAADRTDDLITANPYALSTQTFPYTITYKPGYVRLGTLANRFGEATGVTGEDRPRTILHELGHYLFYLFDNYLGLDETSNIVAVSGCTDTVMTNQYKYTEFRLANDWGADCAQTISARRSGRADWETITKFYPALKAPANLAAAEGPTVLPLNVTQIQEIKPGTASQTLADLIYVFTNDRGALQLASPQAQGVLFHYVNGQPTRLIDLGRPSPDRLAPFGASHGDRICVYDFEATTPRLGCETVEAGDFSLALVDKPDWQPALIVTPISSRTVKVEVRAAISDTETVQAKLYPGSLEATQIQTMTATSAGFETTFNLTDPAQDGYVHVWVDQPENEPETETNPRREAVTNYALGGSPGCDASNPNFPNCRLAPSAAPQANARTNYLPAISPDGQVLLYTSEAFGQGEFYALQKATRLPEALPWTTVVGDGYYVLGSSGTLSFQTASITFRYRGQDVPPGEENFLSLYYWDEGQATWIKLKTARNTTTNEVAARGVGSGLYVLMSSLEIPLPDLGWNLISYPVQETRPVSEALASIAGQYSLIYGYEAGDTADPWKVYAPSPIPGWVNDLNTLEFGQGYWISTTQVITWAIKGAETNNRQASRNLQSPPATYYGQIFGGNGFVPTAGITVTASVNGNLCGQGLTQDIAGQIVYSLNVQGNAFAGGPCGEPGRTVIFQVEDISAQTNTVWQNDVIQELDLNVSAHSTLYLPILIKE